MSRPASVNNSLTHLLVKNVKAIIGQQFVKPIKKNFIKIASASVLFSIILFNIEP